MEIELEIGWFASRTGSIAKFHEKGSATLPIRKHLTEVATSTEFRQYLLNQEHLRVAFKRNIRAGFKELGELFIAYYSNYVLAGLIKPKLKATTIANKSRRGYSAPQTPLVASGAMISAIEYRING
ncbi:hypothetical protein DB313_06255 (plasmid) [Borrelia turcica IST7]|uniref:Uncharacterized protein n=1 Tax=Borrelia turcica IST7 TaxID=1104446 RepID=A0A386PPQ2_9SPIR|nr:hypothetical protein [Borrelia turcica]AYE37102.1 hypothetical protein DB313_06255 [Borrelia turcica IST7]